MMTDKVSLPKFTRNTHYYIFLNISIPDLFLLVLFFGLGVLLALIIPVLWPFKLIIGLFLVGFAWALITKDSGGVPYYVKCFRGVKFLISSKKTKNLIITKDITDISNIVLIQITNTKYYVGGLALESNNLNLLNEREKEQLIADFGLILRLSNHPLKLIKIDEHLNFNTQLNNLKDIPQILHNSWYDEQIKVFNNFNKQTTVKTPYIYLLFFAKTLAQAQAQIATFTEHLFFTNITTEILSNTKISNLYSSLTININNLHISTTTARDVKAKIKSTTWAINSFPNQINYFWLSELINVENVKIVVNLNAISKIKAKKRLDAAVSKTKTNMDAFQKKPSQHSDMERSLDSYERSLEDVTADLDNFKDVSFLMNFSGVRKEAGIIQRNLKDIADITNWKYDKLTFLQKDSLIDFAGFNPKLSRVIGHEMTCGIFATSFPVPNNALTDDFGFFLATNTDGKPIVWDLFLQNSDRVNSNLLILGQSGSGKSLTAKRIIGNLSYRNSKIFILDPEREYKKLTEHLKGEWLDASGSQQNTLNPLEISSFKDDNQTNADVFLEHLAVINSFFEIISPRLAKYPMLSSLLTKTIKELYTNFKITMNSNFAKLKSTDYPIFSDYQKLLLKKFKEIPETNKNSRENLEYLTSIVDLLVDGQYAKYWNGFTKIDLKKSSLICFDLQRLVASGNQKIVNMA